MAHNSNKPEVNGLLVWHGLAESEEIAVICLPLRGESSLRCLSDAEQDVAYYLLDGKAYDEIASARGTAMRTVANQVTSIFRKLKVSTREEFTARVMGCYAQELDIPSSRLSSSSAEKTKKPSQNRSDQAEGKAGLEMISKQKKRKRRHEKPAKRESASTGRIKDAA